MTNATEETGLHGSGGARRLAGFTGLFFLSGVGGLVLQVLWMYRLGLVFGNAAYATAATLSAFFLGLALGGWFWGRAAPSVRRPLAVYGLIELGVAATALLWLPGLGFYEAHYATVTAMLGDNRGFLITGKFVFSTSLLLLPTFLMGGTFPVLAQRAVPDPHELGKRGSLLYAFNTLGAALGALLAGFYLLPVLGVRRAYLAAVALLVIVGVTAVILDRVLGGDDRGRVRGRSASDAVAEPSTPASPSTPAAGDGLVALLAVASGFLTLAAETLWTRMFSQVLQNSVYSFSAILVVFLLALGLGGLLAHALSRTSVAPRRVLGALLVVGALMVGLSPALFGWVTGGLAYVAPRATWTAYLATIFGMVFVVVLPPVVMIGAVFPYLLKATPRMGRPTGPLVGRLVLLNSLGAVAGPIVAGFFLLDLVGLWIAIKIMAVVYGGLALLVVSPQGERRSFRGSALSAVALVVVIVLPSPAVVRLEPGEALREVWQASDGVVSVVESDGGLQMRLDNFYALGDSRSTLVEQMQAHVPLLIHPQPTKVLFLGLGTGLTAGAALEHDVERVVAAELVPNVIRAARRYFSPWTNGLFTDPRAEIVADDARNYLLSSTETFDVIVGDLFTPWHAGTGSLYTVEHFRLVRERLAEGGVFAQWLPLYQLTPEGFETIAATFASVFPQVTVWRADFSDSKASIALVGQEQGARLDQGTLMRNSRNVTGTAGAGAESSDEHMATLFYVGNLSGAPGRFSGISLNTDDRRILELTAPVLSQEANAGRETFVVGAELERFFTTIHAAVPLDSDPYLSSLPSNEVRYADAGLMYFRYLRLAAAGRQTEALEVLARLEIVAPAFADVVVRASGGSP
jgi:spermidine synthase